MRLIRSEMRQYARGQLTVPQFRILIRLNKFSKQSHKELAEWMGVTPATLTRMIDTLVKRRLVSRQTGASDRRLTYLTPTPTGRTLAQKYHDKIDELIHNRINALNQADKDLLKEGIRILSLIFPDTEIPLV
jgi:DNA-binding MarR family transcriptional regulator